MKAFVLCLLAIACPRLSHAEDQFRDGLIRYLSQVSATRHRDPERACKEWATWKKSMDESAVYTLKKTVKGKRGAYDCVFAGPDGEFVQSDGAAPVVECPRGWDPYGVDDDQKCIKRAKAAQEEPLLCDAKLEDPRRKPVTKAKVAQRSQQNVAKLKADPFGRSMIEAYDHEKECIENNTTDGWPKFGTSELYPFGANDLNIGSLCGSREQDFAAANEMAGYAKTPAHYTWHHHQDLGRMQLVKTSAHAPKSVTADGRSHWGGVSIWNAAFCSLDPSFRTTMCRYRHDDAAMKKAGTTPYKTHCIKR